MEHQEVTAMEAINLAAAFDTVNHSIPLEVQNKQFGITGNSSDWFINYLQPRSLCINVGETYSENISLEFSVPKGSCAGPTLCSSYASTMKYIVPGNISLLLHC